MLEDMIKTTPKLTVSNRYQYIYDNYEDSFDIDFSKLTYTAGLNTISINGANGTMTLPAKETSTFSKLLCKKYIKRHRIYCGVFFILLLS